MLAPSQPKPVPDAAPRLAADALAQLAVESLLEELRLYPKPGLVSPVDSGSHRDMDFALMEASARCLLPHFARMAQSAAAGESFANGLIPLGREAERQMLQATGGVNTHRGAIFILGLLVAAAARGGSASPTALRESLVRHYGEELAVHRSRGIHAPSHGGAVRRQTGLGGVRSEAAGGFPAIFEVALPCYQRLLALGLPPDDCAIETLFELILVVDDTNLLFRGGAEGATQAKQGCSAFLEAGGVQSPGWRLRAIALHEHFKQLNLSPGGAADLLAATYFTHKLPAARI